MIEMLRITIASFLILFSYFIKAQISSPITGSTYTQGDTIILLVDSNDNLCPPIEIENSHFQIPPSANVIIMSNNNEQQVTHVTLGISTKVILNMNLSGSTKISAFCTNNNYMLGLTQINIDTDIDTDIDLIDKFTPPPNPSPTPTSKPAPRLSPYVPFYNPYYNPYHPICTIPRRESCNIPRPRCRIRESENFESGDFQMYYDLYLDQQAKAIKHLERENEQQLIEQAEAENNAKVEA